MNFLKGIFSKKDDPIKTNQEFWAWFEKNEKIFYNAVKHEQGIEQYFFDPLSAKLELLKDGFYFLTGMYDDSTVELIITAEGKIKNIAFVEELVAAAPNIEGWRFTALKPEMAIQDTNINMNGYLFNGSTLSFYANELLDYPDEIDISITHRDFTENDRGLITNGIYIFLDNYLGELNFVSTIDNLSIVGKDAVNGELIPIEKLKDYLKWREKEFVEKYEAITYNTEGNTYSSLNATLKSGLPLVAVVNSTLLNWDTKASHPWIVKVEIKFDGQHTNGMPDSNTSQFLNTIKDEMLLELKAEDGYLNIGRQTADGRREVYFACKEFRKPSIYLHQLVSKYSESIPISYKIYKDKYWQSFERFMPK